jgi:hypothetical protein
MYTNSLVEGGVIPPQVFMAAEPPRSCISAKRLAIRGTAR